MSQEDFSLANADGATFRADLNNNLQALASQSEGATAPATTYAHQIWLDSTANLAKIRNAANTAWVTVASWTGTVWIPYRAGAALGTIATKGKEVLAKSGAYTVLAADDGKLIEADATGGAFSVTLLPVATAGDGFTIGVKKIDSSANAVTVDGNAAETIDDALTRVIGAQYEAEWYRCDGTEWWLEGQAGLVQGKVLQIVQTQTGAAATGTTVLPIDDTIPQITEGDEYMQLAITPKSASSELLIEVVWNGATNVGGTTTVALFRDAIAGALAAVGLTNATANAQQQLSLSHRLTSPGVSATTFRIRAGQQNVNTTTFNGVSGARNYGGVMASSITITEYLP